jgi:hypothetical protein
MTSGCISRTFSISSTELRDTKADFRQPTAKKQAATDIRFGVGPFPETASRRSVRCAHGFCFFVSMNGPLSFLL